MRRVLHDAMLSAGALIALIAVLVAFDGRVREQVLQRMNTRHATADVAAAQNQVLDIVNVVTGVVNDAFRLHTTLALFVVIATVLTVFMLRT